MFSGVWLPIITPFVNGEVDYTGYERLLEHYLRAVQGALKAWSRLEPMIPLLFKEPNPVPIKHCLWRQGLIASAECRLPLTRVSETLAGELDRLVPAGVAG